MFIFECMLIMDVGAVGTQDFGGYKYEFVKTPPERVICEICHNPPKEPYQTLCCGHIFCKTCLDSQKKAKSINYACPICRSKADDFKVYHNKAIDREIRALHIYCTNKKEGCDWQGELNNINNHLRSTNGCLFEEAECPNRGCIIVLKRQLLTTHVEMCVHREVSCQYCNEKGRHQFINSQHKEKCPKYPLSCPYRCGKDNIPRDELEEHTSRCSLVKIQCEFHSVGCKAMIARKDMEEHNREMTSEHLRLSVSVHQRNAQNLQEVARRIDERQNTQIVILFGFIMILVVSLYVQNVK